MANSDIITFKYAEPSEFKKVKDFYADAERRTKAVYLRDDAVIQSQISRRMFITARDVNDNMIAGVGLYPLADNNIIDCIADNNGRTIEEGRVVELTSVLKSGKGANDIKPPPGLWNRMLFELAMATAFDQAHGRGIPFDILVCDVQTDRVSTANYITGAESTRSAMKWERIAAAPEMEAGFKATTKDVNVKNHKIFYRAPVRNMYAVAIDLVDIMGKRYVTNRLGQRVPIDLAPLELGNILEKVIVKRPYIESRLHNASWTETYRGMDNLSMDDMDTMDRLVRTRGGSSRPTPRRTSAALRAALANT